MSNRFDSALINREQTRIALAAELDSKYASEVRRKRFSQLLVIGVVSFMGYYAFQGVSYLGSLTKPENLMKKKSILAQMKRQIDDGDQLVVSGEPVPPPPPLVRPGDRDSFEQEKIPLNLYSDLQRKSGAGGSGDYERNVIRLNREIADGMFRRQRNTTFDCGKYRPIAAADYPKLPKKGPQKVVVSASLYVRVAGPGPNLGRDTRSFPDVFKQYNP